MEDKLTTDCNLKMGRHTSIFCLPLIKIRPRSQRHKTCLIFVSSFIMGVHVVLEFNMKNKRRAGDLYE